MTWQVSISNQSHFCSLKPTYLIINKIQSNRFPILNQVAYAHNEQVFIKWKLTSLHGNVTFNLFISNTTTDLIPFFFPFFFFNIAFYNNFIILCVCVNHQHILAFNCFTITGRIQDFQQLRHFFSCVLFTIPPQETVSLSAVNLQTAWGSHWGITWIRRITHREAISPSLHWLLDLCLYRGWRQNRLLYL